MESLNQPQPFPAMRPMNQQPGMMLPPNQFVQMRAPYPFNMSEQEEKKNEFKRAIFVSGFEKCVTTAMLQKHFSIKPINGLKHPMTKFKESKGFAFIYYGSEDDALYVKKNLDRTAILKEKVRITRTVISENLSKMMFKLKTYGLSEQEVSQNQKKYFNDENLQKQVQRIINPIFNGKVEVNKITIPKSKSTNKSLRYARVFFYVSDVKEAKTIAQNVKNTQDIPYDSTGKNEYQVILNIISHLINKDDIFGAIAKSQIYEYTKKNQSNVLHLKGVKFNPNEDPTSLADQIKEFMQKQGLHWNIVNAFAAIHQKRGAWANLTFSSHEETIQAYEHLKSLKPKFRDCILYGSLRNVKDPRTVVISVVRKEVTEKEVEKFLNDLASKSVKQDTPGEQPLRKYDFFSFNIIQSKRFFKIDGDETKGVTQADKDIIHPSWIEINEVPRRLIIHFYHEFNDQDIKELNNDIVLAANYDNIFIRGDKTRQLRSNHQKGHVNKDGIYIKHTEIKGKKKPRNVRPEKPLRPRPDFNAGRGMPGRNHPTRPGMDFSMGGLPSNNKQAPKMPPNMNMRIQGSNFRPQIGAVGSLSGVPPSTRPPIPGAFGSSSMPQANLPPTGNLPPPNIPPQSSMPPSNMPSMGMNPPQNFKPGPYGSQPMGMPPGNLPQNPMPPQRMMNPQIPGQFAPPQAMGGLSGPPVPHPKPPQPQQPPSNE